MWQAAAARLPISSILERRFGALRFGQSRAGTSRTQASSLLLRSNQLVGKGQGRTQGTATWQQRGTATWQQRGTATWQQGGIATWQQRAMSATSQALDAAESRRPYRVLPDSSEDWVKSLELDSARAFSPEPTSAPAKILVLYGSLRERSYSRLLAYEFARILESLGCDVQVYDPEGLPMKDDKSEKHPKVVELRDLSLWSEGHVWVCPEQHGTITAVFKNQIDWIPLSLGSVRPTQGRTVAIAQVNGGSQSFNVVNTLRVLGRWMRMIAIPNQSSIPKAWTEFTDQGRLKPSSYRDRVVDVAEEMHKFTLLLRGHSEFLVDRYSEREEKRVKGRLLSQAEKEKEKEKEKEMAKTTPSTV